MANPQLKDGYTEIANEILEQLIKLHLAPNQWQVLLYVIRRTYGYRKKVDYIANSQIGEVTGLCKSVVSRSLSVLEDLKLIVRSGKNIGLQKDWEQWEKLAESSTKVSNTANKSSQNSQLKLAESSIKVSNTANKTEKTPEKKLAESSTKVSSPRLVTKKKESNIKKKESKTKRNIYSEFLINYSPEFQKVFYAFIENRKFINKPISPHGVELALIKLKKLSSSESTQIAIINQSIERSYQGLFPLKDGQCSNNELNTKLTIDEELKKKGL